MTLSTQSIPLIQLELSRTSKAMPLNDLQHAFALHPSMEAVGDQVVLGTSGLSHLAKSNSPQSLNPLSGLPTHSDAELKQVSQNFESIFMQMIFKEMRNSVQKSDLFGHSQGMEFFESMYDDQLMQKMASAGGMGLGQMIYEKLKTVTTPHQKTFS